MMTGKDLTNQEKVDLMFEYLTHTSPLFCEFVKDNLNQANSFDNGDIVYYNKVFYLVREVRMDHLECVPIFYKYEQICQKFDKINKIEIPVYGWGERDILPFNVKKINSILVVECVEWFENGKAKKVPGVYYVTSLDDWQPKQILRTKEVPFVVKTL